MTVKNHKIAIVLCRQEASASDRNLLGILGFFGIESIRVSPTEQSLCETVARMSGGRDCCLLTSAENLDTALHGGRNASLLGTVSSAFVFDFSPHTDHERTLRELTGLPTLRIHGVPGGKGAAEVSRDRPEVCGPMSGIRVAEVASETVFVIPAKGEKHETLIKVGEGSAFVSISHGNSSVFVSSGGVTVDLNEPVSGNYFDIKDYFLGAVPLVMYVRWAFQNQIWRNSENSASLIIDDPSLKARYGFMVFDDVFRLMQQHNFSSTIAFIPWNWKRTRRRTAELFVRHPDRYSLAVHGTDHTSGEFGSVSAELLDCKVRTAIARMDAHEKRTGVKSSRVMVFPQGIFSSQAIAALKANNFVAAVNTEVNPTNEPQKPEIRELWAMAIMKFSSFPVFTRRYMEHGIENFAFDLLLGKPCLLVGHHEVFRDHAERLVAFVDDLNSLNCSLRWRGLDDTVRRSFKIREAEENVADVQMFASEVVLDARDKAVFRVNKQESSADAIHEITVNQKPVAWQFDGQQVRFSFEVPAGESARVTIRYKSKAQTSLCTPGLGYKIKCGLRRRLSEFRDDYVCRSALLSQCTHTLRRWFL